MGVDRDQLTVGVFAALVFGTFGLAATFVVRWGRERAYGVAPLGRIGRWIRATTWAFAVIGVICLLYGRLVEPFWPAVTHVEVTLAKLPKGTRPIRIVHLSDLHSDPSPRLEERLPGLVAAQHPDLIVFSGDAINSPEGLPVFRRCLAALAKIAPTYVVRGNWDAWWWSEIDLFGETGAVDLGVLANSGQHATVDVRGTRIVVAGVAVENEVQIPAILAGFSPSEIGLFVHHYPDEVDLVAKHPVDVYLAGHTHGGQVALPLYGALVTLSRFGKRFEAGLYRVHDTQLYVNRGIGMEGGTAPRVRFCSRPEIAVLDLVPSHERR